MDNIRIKYRILFNIQLELTGFQGDLNQYFTLMPDEKTEELITWYRSLSKKQQNSSTFLIETHYEGADEDKSKIPLEDNEMFRFQLKLRVKNFINNTNLANYDFVNKVLLVSNSIVNKPGGELLLTAPLAGYSATAEYKKGFLVTSTGTNYKALLPSNSADSHFVTETDYWKPIPKIGVSQADLVERSTLTEQPDIDTIMVLQIENKNTIDADYRILDGASKVREVNYLLRFQNPN